MCAEIEDALNAPGGALETVSDELSRADQELLRRKTAQLRIEIRRIASEISLDASVFSIRRKIYALISASIVNLEESDPKKLRGYGMLSEAAIEQLEREFAVLLAILEEMGEICEGA